MYNTVTLTVTATLTVNVTLILTLTLALTLTLILFRHWHLTTLQFHSLIVTPISFLFDFRKMNKYLTCTNTYLPVSYNTWPLDQ